MPLKGLDSYNLNYNSLTINIKNLKTTVSPRPTILEF